METIVRVIFILITILPDIFLLFRCQKKSLNSFAFRAMTYECQVIVEFRHNFSGKRRGWRFSSFICGCYLLGNKNIQNQLSSFLVVSVTKRELMLMRVDSTRRISPSFCFFLLPSLDYPSIQNNFVQSLDRGLPSFTVTQHQPSVPNLI